MSVYETEQHISSYSLKPLNGWHYNQKEEHRIREDWARKIEWLIKT